MTALAYTLGTHAVQQCGNRFNAALASSKKDGRLRYIIPLATGWIVSLRRRPMIDCYWTNGTEAGSWSAGAKEGVKIPELAL